MFCIRCGRPMVAGANFCAFCGQGISTSPLASSAETAPRTKASRSLLKIISTVLWTVTTIIYVVGLFVPYYRGGAALMADGLSVAYNTPGLLLVLLAGALVFFRHTYLFAAGLIIGYAPLACLDAIKSIADVVTDHADAGAGFILERLANVLMLASALVALAGLIVARRLRWTLKGAALWAVAGAALAILELVGQWLPWEKTTASGLQNGERVSSSRSCCTLFSEQVDSVDSIASALAIAAAVGLLIFAACIGSRSLSSALIVGTAAASLGSVLFSVAHQATWKPDYTAMQASSGLDPAAFDALRIIQERTLLPGMWLTTASVILLFLLALGRGLRPDPDTIRNPAPSALRPTSTDQEPNAVGSIRS